MMNISAELDGEELVLTGKAGTTWELEFVVTDDDGNEIDLSDKTVSAHVRRSYGEDVLACFDVSVSVGTVTMTMPVASTSALGGQQIKRYVFDVKAYDAEGRVDSLLGGTLYVTPDVTRSETCPL